MNNKGRRNSEYSAHSMSHSKTNSQQIHVNDEEQKAAKSQLYSVLFSSWRAKIAILPSLIVGSAPIVIFLVFGEILNKIQMWSILSTVKTSLENGK